MSAWLMINYRDVGENPRMQDGDIVGCKNRQAIGYHHAGRICHVNKFGFTSDGLRPNSIARTIWYDNLSPWRFHRATATTYERRNAQTGTVAEVNANPNLQEYLDRKKRSANHKLFGTPGREIWYGGNFRYLPAVIDTIWSAIEGTLPDRRRGSNDEWPFSPYERRAFLCLPSTDFDENRRHVLMRTESEEMPDTRPGERPGQTFRYQLRFRRQDSQWATLTGLTESDVRDTTTEVDLSARTPEDESTLVVDKGDLPQAEKDRIRAGVNGPV